MNQKYQISVELQNGDKIVHIVDTNDIDLALDQIKILLERRCALNLVATAKIYQLRELPYRLHIDELIRDHNKQLTPF